MNSENSVQPPRLARVFLKSYCREEFLEEIEGDAYELFEVRLVSLGLFRARLLFIWDVIRFFRASNIKQTTRFNSNFISMTRNNFKIAARILWRHKMNTVMNVMGIAIGIACFILITLYVRQEVTFDQFHEKKDNIYRAWVKEVYSDGRVINDIFTPPALGPTLNKDIPEVEAYALVREQSTLVGRGDGRITDRVERVTSNFFDVFDFEIIAGNKTEPFSQLSHVVLSESYAQKYFGNTDPIGKMLSLEINDSIADYVVNAVVEDAPQNTSIPYNMLISFDNEALAGLAGAQNGWFNISMETYVLLREGTNTEDLSTKTRTMIGNTVVEGDTPFDGEPVEDHYLVQWQPLTDIHLNTEIPPGRSAVGNPQTVYILGAIGFLVMIIACVNYTTLSIGQSFKRSKEVGMRKVVGAKSSSLLWQYLSESILIAALATIFGVLFTFLMLPVFNELAQTSLTLPKGTLAIGFALLLAFVIGSLSGIYPALVLSRFRVIHVLSGASSSSGKQMVRKGMVVFQFLLTVFLISSTLIMRKQLNFLQNKDLGFSYDAMVSVPLYPSAEAQNIVQAISTAMENGDLLKGELMRNTQFSDFAMGSHMFGTSGWATIGFNATDGNYMGFNLLLVNSEYLNSFGVNMLKGRNFDALLESDKQQGVIINQAAAEYFGWEDPIGKKLPNDAFGEHIVIGVTSDFNFRSLHTEVSPLVIVQNPMIIFPGIADFNSGDTLIPKLAFRYTGNNLTEVKNLLEPSWNKLFPTQELNFNFLEERLNNQYQEEARTNRIVSIATILSIFIASLGLLALTVLVVNTKVKEIGIRKVMGASPKIIFGLLVKGFSIQLLIAVLLSVPITWYLMQNWLDSFEYRVGIGVEMFLFSGLISLVIMLVVVSYHVIRASSSNPVRALRAE